MSATRSNPAFVALSTMLAVLVTPIAAPAADTGVRFAAVDRSIAAHLAAGRVDSAAAQIDLALRLAGDVHGGDPIALAQYADSLAYRFFDAYADSAGVYLFERSLQLRESAVPPYDLSLAEALETLATAYYVAGRVADSVTPQERALGIRIAHLGEDDPAVAASRYELALVYYELTRYDEAEDQLRTALVFYRSQQPEEPMAIAEVERMLGETCREQNRYDEADRRIERALTLARGELAANDPGLVAFLNSLAGCYRDEARFDEAELLMEEALRIRSAAGLEDELAIPTLNLAEIYRFQGRYDDAVPLYQEAIRLATDYFPELEVAEFYNQLAAVYVEMGRLADAESQYRKALAVVEPSPYASPQVVAQSKHDAAVLMVMQSNYDDAERLCREALALREDVFGRAHPLVASTLTVLAGAVAEQDRDAEALSLLDRAVAIFEATDAEPEARADALVARAELLYRDGRVDEAVLSLAEALDVVEALRPYRGGGRAERIGFLNRYLRYYDRMIEWRLARGDVTSAISYAERMRSRVLLDRLAGGGVVPLQGASDDAVEAMRATSVELESRLATCQANVRAMRSRQRMSTKDRQELARAERECDEIVEDLQRTNERMRRLDRVSDETSVGVAAGFDIGRAVAAVVPANGALLFYYIGADESHVFVVAPRADDIARYPLRLSADAASALGTTAGAVSRDGLAAIITGYNSSGDEVGPGMVRRLSTPVASASSNAVVARAQQRFHRQLNALFAALIPAAVWNDIRDAQEVVVVPDGPLLGLPFEALVVDPHGEDGATWWLDRGPVIRYAPSITTLTAIARRSRPAARAGESVLSVCNPQFGPGGDERPTAETAGTAAWIGRERFATRGGSLQPLPGTERESSLLVDAFGAHNVTVLCGAAATEEAVRAAANDKRIVHLATHGLVSLRRNDLLAALALTPDAGAAGDPGRDGFLQLFEIYDLDLSAELAILSACESNYGRYVPGEGVMALARGFHAAGASRVVSSIWKVDDAVTAEFMGAYFERIAAGLGKTDPVDYARALRDAKRTVRRDSRWSHPFYWAAFVTSGVH
jgi:CHAT domain-containing protein/tetratricopeptide (TPR) repeat protein